MDNETGYWCDVLFLGYVLLGWVPPLDLWDIYADDPMPSPDHVLAQLADDASYRWLLPA